MFGLLDQHRSLRPFWLQFYSYGNTPLFCLFKFSVPLVCTSLQLLQIWIHFLLLSHRSWMYEYHKYFSQNLMVTDRQKTATWWRHRVPLANVGPRIRKRFQTGNTKLLSCNGGFSLVSTFLTVTVQQYNLHKNHEYEVEHCAYLQLKADHFWGPCNETMFFSMCLT